MKARRRNTRHPHAFSKGRGVGMEDQGGWRPQAPCMLRMQAPDTAFTQAETPALKQPPGDSAEKTPALKQRSDSATTPALEQRSGSAKKTTSYPIALDPRRWTLLRVSPTIATLYKGHMGVAVICADCLHGVGHRNPGLPDRFRREWHLTLLELEKRCRCEMCGARNARAYPWSGDIGGELGLDGPPGAGP